MEVPVAVADTSFVVALANRKDRWHESCVRIYSQFKTILLPQTVLAETAYLIGQKITIQSVVAFVQNLPKSRFANTALSDAELLQAADILSRYHDSRIDFVDATVMAVAEQHSIRQILTLDQRDFRLYRPQQFEAFDLLP